jgi:hypothetical protein
MKRILFTTVATVALLGLSGCMSVETNLTVVQDGLVLNGDNGSVSIPQGTHDMQISIARSASSPSSIALKDMNQKFRISLPPAKDLASITKPLVLSSDQLQQPIQMTFEREADSNVDHYGVTISSQDGSTVLATARFDYTKSSTQAYDEQNKTFLMSFQDVKRSQRAVFIPIDGMLDGNFYIPVGENAIAGDFPINSIVNHSAMILLAPWVYARYSTVEWFISINEMNDNDILNKVKDGVNSSPVIDLFAFNHGGNDAGTIDVAKQNGLKTSQLRLVYTEGCDSSGYISSFLSDDNAAVAIGHSGTSASPLFAFNIVHSWTYGESAHASMVSGWLFGTGLLEIADMLSFDQLHKTLWDSHDDMIKESEPQIVWTSEMTPDKLNIDTSAVLMRNTQDLSTAYQCRASEYGKNAQTSQLTMNLNTADPSATDAAAQVQSQVQQQSQN